MISLGKTMLTAGFLSLALMFAGIGMAHAQDYDVKPTPDFGPSDVVTIQMQALQNNDDPFDGAGIEITFRFASPNNKRVTGPLEKFSTLFDNPAYGPMLNHRSLEIGDVDIVENRARVPVFMEAEDGSQMAYVFILSKQGEGEWTDCWMTDSVTLVQVNRPEKVTL